MSRYRVYLTTEIEVSIDIDANSIEDAETNWDRRKGLSEAKLAVLEQVKDLDGYEFDVNDVEDLEGERKGEEE